MNKLFLFITPLLLILGCGQTPNTTGNETEDTSTNEITLTNDQLKNAGIRTENAILQEMPEILRTNGIIDVPPQNMVSISLPLGGYLQTTQLLPGMHVVKNEVIATIENEQFIELQQNYLMAKSRLTMAEKEYYRQKELQDNNAGSEKILQQSESAFLSQKIEVKGLSEKLKLIHLNPDQISEKTISRSIKIYSPIDGFVKHVNVNIGKYVLPSEVLFELVNPEDIHLNLKIFEKDLNKLSIGQQLLAFNNNQPQVKYPCEIILISKDLKADRSAEVHCHFEKYDKTLLPGMFMNAEITLRSVKNFTVPSAAILSYDNKQYVFIALSENRFEMKEIKTGNSENELTEIFGDSTLLNHKTRFVTGGAYSLLMQLKNTSE